MAAVAAEMKKPEAMRAYEAMLGDNPGKYPPGSHMTFKRFCEVRVLDLAGPDAFPMRPVKPAPPAAD
jgi:hypothetical protein